MVPDLARTATMDALKAEIAKKRKAAEEAAGERPTKYMKKGELERLEREKEAKLKAEEEAKREEERRLKAQVVSILHMRL